METRGKKRLVAAVAAVYRYLRSQEEQKQLAMAAAVQPVVGPAVAAASFWSASGRQATMESYKVAELRPCWCYLQMTTE